MRARRREKRAMQLSDEDSVISYEDRSIFERESEDDELFVIRDEDTDDTSVIYGGDGGFMDFKMSKGGFESVQRNAVSCSTVRAHGLGHTR
jgi:hypothetical protein